MIVRGIETADFARWLPLWEGYNAFYGRAGETRVPNPVTRRAWDRFLDPAEPMFALVAEEGESLLGLVHYIFHRNTLFEGPVCYLQDLFTTREARGKGVGRALIEAVYGAARAAGSERVYWLTQDTNHTAMRLYDQVAVRPGFVVYRKDL